MAAPALSSAASDVSLRLVSLHGGVIAMLSTGRTSFLIRLSSVVLVCLTGALVAQQPAPPAKLLGHTAPLNSAIFTRDGAFIVTGSSDQQLKIWDAKTRLEVRSLQGHTGQVVCLAGSPDSRVIASGGSDNSVRLWDIPQPRPLHTYAGHTLAVRHVVISADKRSAVTVGDDKSIRFWDLETRKVSAVWDKQEFEIERIAFRPDGRQVATADAAGRISLWNPLLGQATHVVNAHVGKIADLKYHPNNLQIITLGVDGSLKVWQLPTAKPNSFVDHTAGVTAINVANNGTFAITTDGAKLRVINLATGALLRDLEAGPLSVHRLAGSANDAVVAAAVDDGSIQFWTVADGKSVGSLSGHLGMSTAISFHPDNARIASVGEDGTARIWKLPQPDISLPGHTKSVRSVARSADGQFFATSSDDATVKLFNAVSGVAVREFAGHGVPVPTVRFAKHAALLFSGDEAGTARLFNAVDGALQVAWGAHDTAIKSADFDPAGTWMVTSGADGTLKRWAMPLTPPVSFAGHTASVTSVDTSSDGKLVVTASNDKSIRQFNGDSGEFVRALGPLPTEVSSVRLIRDNSVVVAGELNGEISFWSAATGAPGFDIVEPADAAAPVALPTPARLIAHSAEITSLDSIGESKQLVSASADGSVRVWGMPRAASVLVDATAAISCFARSKDRTQLAVGTTIDNRPAIVIRDMKTGRVLQTLLGHQEGVQCIGFNDEGTMLLSGSTDKSVRIWNLRDVKFPEAQRFQTATAVTAVTFDADSTHALFATTDNQIHKWSISDGAEVKVFAGHTAAVTQLTTTSTNLLISAALDSTIRIWNQDTAAVVRSLNHAAAVHSIAVSPDEKLIASGGADNLVKLWNAADGAAVLSLGSHATAIVSLDFDDSSGQLCSISTNSIVHWDVVTGQRVEVFGTGEWTGLGGCFAAIDPAETATFRRQPIAVAGTDGQVRSYQTSLQQMIVPLQGGVISARAIGSSFLVTGGSDKLVRIWNAGTGENVVSLAGAVTDISALAVTDDGAKIAASTISGKVFLWNTPADLTKPIAIPVPFEREWLGETPVTSVIFGDSETLAWCGDDKLVHVWDLTTGKLLQRFIGHADSVTDISMTSDGRRIIAGCKDNTVKSWQVEATVVAVADAPFEDICVTNDGAKMVAVDGTSNISTWAVADGKLANMTLASVGDKSIHLMRLAAAPNNTSISLLSTVGSVFNWDLEASKLNWQSPPTTTIVEPPAADLAIVKSSGGLVYSESGDRIVVGSGTTVQILAAENGMPLQSCPQTAKVNSVGCSADGTRFCAALDGEADNAKLQTVAIEQLLNAHEKGALDVKFSRDGLHFVTSGGDGAVRVWKTEDGTLVREFLTGEVLIPLLNISADGMTLIGGGNDEIIRVWDLSVSDAPPAADANEATPIDTTSKLREWAANHGGALRDMRLSADTTRLVTCGDDAVVRIWDVASGRELQRFTEHADVATGVGFLPDNRTVISASKDKSLRIEITSALRLIVADEAVGRRLELVAAGAQAIALGGSNGPTLWNLANGQVIRQFGVVPKTETDADAATETPAEQAAPSDMEPVADEVDAPNYTALAVTVDGTQLCAVDDSGQAAVFNVADASVVSEFLVPAKVNLVQFSPDKSKLVVAAEDNHLRFYNPVDGASLYELTSEQTLSALTFDSDNRRVITGADDGTVNLWAYASPTAVRTLNGHGGSVFGVAFSRDGKRVASASLDQSIRLWDVKTGAQTSQLTGHLGAVYSVAFSPNGALLVSCGADKTVRLWDVLGARQLKQIPLADASVYSVAFHRDGKRVVAAGLDKKIRVLDVFTGIVQTTMEGHTDYIYRVAYNATGTRLLSCGYGGKIIVWNAANGQQLFATELDRVANSADFSPDSRRVVVAGGDGAAHFVDVPANAQ
jgi:WD40 repeat protein